MYWSGWNDIYNALLLEAENAYMAIHSEPDVETIRTALSHAEAETAPPSDGISPALVTAFQNTITENSAEAEKANHYARAHRAVPVWHTYKWAFMSWD